MTVIDKSGRDVRHVRIHGSVCSPVVMVGAVEADFPVSLRRRAIPAAFRRLGRITINGRPYPAGAPSATLDQDAVALTDDHGERWLQT